MPEENKIVRWSKTAVTDDGTGLLTEFAAGRILDITGAYGSISDPDGNLTELKELPDGRMHPLTIESVTRTDDSVTVCVQVTSLGNDEPYKLECIGITAMTRDPGEPKLPGEIIRDDKLLMIIEDTEDEKGSKGVTIPAETDQLYTFKLYAVLTITNKERLEVSVSTAGIATIGAIQDAMDQHNKDPEAHAELLAELIRSHNADPEAHPSLTARARSLELALNGSVTITEKGDPTTETKGKKDQHYINTETGEEFVCTDDKDDTYTWEKIDYDSEKQKSLREALEEAQATAKAAKDVADGAAQAIAAVQNTISVVPSQSGSLIYNKGVQKPSWNNYATEMMEVTYGEQKTPEAEFQGETEAGTYTAYFKPKDDYTWGDKSKDEKAVTWTIQRATVASVPSVSGTLTYNGSPQAPTWKNFNEEQLTKEETEQTNAGEHSTVFTPKDNYQWSGGDTGAKTVKWTIEQAVPTFSISPKDAQSISVGGTVEIQVTSNSDANIAAESNDVSTATATVDQGQKKVTITGIGEGAAVITISCKGSKNYADASATVNVSVSRINPTFSISPTGDKTLAIGASAQISVTTNSDGAVSANSNAPGVATAAANGKTVTISGASAGNAVITISVAQTMKYNAASVTVNVAVQKPTVSNSSWDDIKAISDAGTAASYFATGDVKSITLNGTVGTLALNNLKVDAFILGINHNASKEGNNRIHWAIGKASGTKTSIALCDSKYNSNSTDGTKCFNMNHWGNYNYGGWKGCDLRYDILGSTNKQPDNYQKAASSGRKGYDPSNYDIVNNPVSGTLAAAFPIEVRRVLKTVTKYTDNVAGGTGDVSGNVSASEDYFFLLAEKEVYGGNRTYSNSYEANYQEQYAYFVAGNSKQLYKHDATGTAVWGRLRSPRYSHSSSFASVGAGAGGPVYNNYAHHSGGLFAGFTT